MKLKDLKLPSVVAGFTFPKKKGIDPSVFIEGIHKNSPDISEPEELLKLALWLIKAANELKKVKDANAFNRD